MQNVLTWAAIYLLTMFLGYSLKRIGIFKAEDRKILSDLIFYVTLPAMLVSSFSGVSVDFWYLVACALGIALNVLMITAAMLASVHKTPEMKALYIINGAGLNLGNIAIPYLQNFFPSGIPYLCMLDVGDSFFSLGTTYAVACMSMGQKPESRLKAIIKSLVTSLPFDVYIFMTVLSILHITLPQPVLLMADFAGRGNGFLAMFMVGVSLELKLDRRSYGEIAQILLLRYLCGAAVAAFTFFVLPAPLIMRQILSVAVFAAVPNACLIYTIRLGVHTEIASALSTISTILMIPIMALVMAFVI